MQPNWENNTGVPCNIDKKSLTIESTAALTKEFAASNKLDLMVGRNPVQLVPVDINIFALNTEDFTESLVNCFRDAIDEITDLESLCKEFPNPEVSPSYINYII